MRGYCINDKKMDAATGLLSLQSKPIKTNKKLIIIKKTVKKKMPITEYLTKINNNYKVNDLKSDEDLRDNENDL